jgi:hypothetical protein
MQDRKTGRPDDRLIDVDATSKETLADVEESEKSSGSESEATARESDLPSPDGTLDQPDEIKDAGPV